jgi:aminoglycoside phosphotransferase (APT) family kinase protein
VSVKPLLADPVFPGLAVASLEKVPATLIHRDLNQDHILLAGDRLSLVDLDNFAAADPVLDVANVGRYDAGDLT